MNKKDCTVHSHLYSKKFIDDKLGRAKMHMEFMRISEFSKELLIVKWYRQRNSDGFLVFDDLDWLHDGQCTWTIYLLFHVFWKYTFILASHIVTSSNRSNERHAN